MSLTLLGQPPPVKFSSPTHSQYPYLGTYPHSPFHKCEHQIWATETRKRQKITTRMANPNPAAVTQHLTALNMSFIDSVASKVMYPCPPQRSTLDPSLTLDSRLFLVAQSVQALSCQPIHFRNLIAKPSSIVSLQTMTVWIFIIHVDMRILFLMISTSCSSISLWTSFELRLSKRKDKTGMDIMRCTLQRHGILIYKIVEKIGNQTRQPTNQLKIPQTQNQRIDRRALPYPPT